MYEMKIPASTFITVQHIEVVSAVRFRNVAIGVDDRFHCP